MFRCESVEILRSIQCYTEHSAYLADMSSVDVCLLHDWLSLATSTTAFGNACEEPSEQVEHKKKWWRNYCGQLQVYAMIYFRPLAGHSHAETIRPCGLQSSQFCEC